MNVIQSVFTWCFMNQQRYNSITFCWDSIRQPIKFFTSLYFDSAHLYLCVTYSWLLSKALLYGRYVAMNNSRRQWKHFSEFCIQSMPDRNRFYLRAKKTYRNRFGMWKKGKIMTKRFTASRPQNHRHRISTKSVDRLNVRMTFKQFAWKLQRYLFIHLNHVNEYAREHGDSEHVWKWIVSKYLMLLFLHCNSHIYNFICQHQSTHTFCQKSSQIQNNNGIY